MNPADVFVGPAHHEFLPGFDHDEAPGSVTTQLFRSAATTVQPVRLRRSASASDSPTAHETVGRMSF